MNRRDLLRATTGLGLLILTGCASGRRHAVADSGVDTLPPTTPRSPTRQSRRPEWLDEVNPQGGLQANVIPRSSWAQASPIISRADPMVPANKITVHHDGMSPYFSTSQADAMRRLESIRKAHVGQGWADIGYHFSIDPAGRVYGCRPLSLQGAHVKDQNPGNIGVMVMGNFEAQQPTAAALTSLETFVGELMRKYRIGTRSVFTHRELASTACPGRNLQSRMVAARSAGGKLAFA